MDLLLENHSKITLEQCAIRFDKNYLGCEPQKKINMGVMKPGGTSKVSLPLVCNKAPGGKKKNIVRMVIKTKLGVCFFNDTIPAYIFFDEDGKMDKRGFLRLWPTFPDSDEITKKVSGRKYKS